MALVDMVIRLIPDDINVHKYGLMTSNQKDFADVFGRHRIEFL